MEDQVQRDLIEAAEHLRELRAVKAAVRVKTAVIADHDVRKIAVSDRFLRFYLNEIQWQIESEADAATDSPVEHFQRSWRALIAFIDEHPALIRMGLRSKSLPIIFEIISEHVFASSSRRVRAYCGAVTDSPALADTLATFTVGGLIQNLKRYLTEPNLDPDALTAEMTTVFEHLWNSFTSEARGETP